VSIRVPPPGRDLCLKVAVSYKDCSAEYRRKYSQAGHEIATIQMMSLDVELLDALSTSPYVIDCYGYGYMITQDGCNLYCLLLEPSRTRHTR
jgi:hypothetical protein